MRTEGSAYRRPICSELAVRGAQAGRLQQWIVCIFASFWPVLQGSFLRCALGGSRVAELRGRKFKCLPRRGVFTGDYYYFYYC